MPPVQHRRVHGVHDGEYANGQHNQYKVIAQSGKQLQHKQGNLKLRWAFAIVIQNQALLLLLGKPFLSLLLFARGVIHGVVIDILFPLSLIIPHKPVFLKVVDIHNAKGNRNAIGERFAHQVGTGCAVENATNGDRLLNHLKTAL